MLTNKLIKQAADISKKSMDMSGKLTDAFIERYGVTYSDVDADGIIDVLDYGGGSLTLQECDEIMTNLGYPPKESA